MYISSDIPKDYSVEVNVDLRIQQENGNNKIYPTYISPNIPWNDL